MCIYTPAEKEHARILPTKTVCNSKAEEVLYKEVGLRYFFLFLLKVKAICFWESAEDIDKAH